MNLKIRLFPLIIVAMMIVSLTGVHAAVLLNQNQIDILNSMNELRRRENDVPLTANEKLNIAAQRLLDDIFIRNLNDLGDTLQLSDGTGINQLLQQAGYESYNGYYEVDVATLIVRDFNPAQVVIDYWNRNYEDTDGLQSKLMLEDRYPYIPIYATFREVGIAYRFNEVNNRHYYVMIFATQPDVFPIFITQLTSNDVISTTSVPDIIVHVPNYITRLDYDGFIMQNRIEYVRISESSSTQDCPQFGDDLWQNYRENYQYTLSEGTGTKQVYVQLCDAEGNTITETTSIIYGEATISEDTTSPQVMDAVMATQTAAVQATEYAQILPTIEAILTATATAP